MNTVITDNAWRGANRKAQLGLLGIAVLFAVCSSANADPKCADPRNLCPNPQICFLDQQAQNDWADKHDCYFITTAMLDAADPSGSSSYHTSIVQYINKYAREYNVNTPERMAHFLSQVGYESGFKATNENLNYSAKRMRQIFGCVGGPKNYDSAKDDCKHGRLRGKLWTEEAKYARNPENLGNYVYADRFGNGDESSGDGYKFRGRGLIQLTFHDNYEDFQAAHNARNPRDQQSFIDNPDLLSNNIQYGIESSFYFWYSHGINEVADSGTVEDVTKKVNGGSNGLPERTRRYNAVACLVGAKLERV